MSLPTERATNLRNAYRVCDVKPLEGDDLDRYYVQLGDARKTEAMMNITTKLDLQEPDEHSTILFTGHRGCGKSTELRLLERIWRKDYHVIYLEADEVTDVNDIAETFHTKRAANDEIGQQTLFNTSVLEYNGKQRWNYPHPTVLNIDACQQAITALTQQS